MKNILYFLVFSLCCAVAAAHAEEPGDSPVSVRAQARYIGSADFKDTNGGAQVTSVRLGLGLDLDVGEFSFSYTGDKYSWSDKQALPFGNGVDTPWDSLHKLSLGYEYNGDINNDWDYSVALTLNSAFEKEMGGSYGAALRGGFGYTFNDNWSARFGGRVFTNSVETSIMPYLGIHYENFAQDGSGMFMTLGAPSTEAGYAFSKSSTLRFAFELEGDTYRLKDNSSVARKGYLETSSMVTGLYYDWKPTDALSLSVGPEYHFGREMQIYNSDGDKIGNAHKQDSAIGGLLKVKYEF